jgi:DNA processing protein
MSRFGSAYEIYRATDEELTGFDADGNERLHRLTDKELDDSIRILEYCFSQGIEIISYDADKYPSRLRMLQDPPAVLYCRGHLPDFENRLCIAIVGTRKMSEYGRDAAYKIAYELSEAGAVTVSGMALGVDALAACGSLSAGGSTVAVLGCGVDRVYPAKHGELMDAIISKGCVISEYAPGTEPFARNFPQRNRIISGLCQGTLVVEADESSGALITAGTAILQGRSIFALPGNINAAGSKGTNALIIEGAQPVTCAKDILDNYCELYSKVLNVEAIAGSRSDFSAKNAKRYKLSYAVDEVSAPAPKNKKKSAKVENAVKPTAAEPAPTEPARAVSADNDPRLNTLDENAKRIYALLKPYEDTRVEAITSTGIPVGQIMASLTVLEIMGLAEQRPCSAYRRK